MKIWIDITNAPHINFFKPFVGLWEKQGFEVVITARDLSNTLDLLDEVKWPYRVIGGHGGKLALFKILKFPVRVLKLASFLRRERPDVGISQSSFYSPLAGKLAKVPTIYTNDNEYAKGNLLAFRFASVIIVPKVYKSYLTKNNIGGKYKINYYNGVKEAIYLSQNQRKNLPIPSSESKVVYVRLEPWSAQYYKSSIGLLDEFIIDLGRKYQVILLPRGEKQASYYEDDRFESVKVAKTIISLDEIRRTAYFFVGAGGSMTRELAILGVRTLSIYRDELLLVDRLLIRLGVMHHSQKPCLSDVDRLLEAEFEGNKSLMIQGAQAFNLINNHLKPYVK